MCLQDVSELDAFVRDVWTGNCALNLGRELSRVGPPLARSGMSNEQWGTVSGIVASVRAT